MSRQSASQQGLQHVSAFLPKVMAAMMAAQEEEEASAQRPERSRSAVTKEAETPRTKTEKPSFPIFSLIFTATPAAQTKDAGQALSFRGALSTAPAPSGEHTDGVETPPQRETPAPNKPAGTAKKIEPNAGRRPAPQIASEAAPDAAPEQTKPPVLPPSEPKQETPPDQGTPAASAMDDTSSSNAQPASSPSADSPERSAPPATQLAFSAKLTPATEPEPAANVAPVSSVAPIIEEQPHQPQTSSESVLPAPVASDAPAHVAASAHAEEPAPASPAAEPEPPADAAGARVSDVRLQLSGQNNQRVDVRLMDRGGELHVTVRGADEQVVSALQDNLPELAARLDQQHVRAEIWAPRSGAVESSAPSAADRQTGGERQDDNQNRHSSLTDDSAGRQRRDRRSGREWQWPQ